MRVKVGQHTVDISYSFSEDNEIAYDVYVEHTDKSVAEDVMDLLLDAMSHTEGSIDTEEIEDKYNVSAVFFIADTEDSDDLIELKKSNWFDDYRDAIKKLRTIN